MRHHLGAGVRDDIPLLALKPHPQTDEPCHVGSGRAPRAVGACRNRATGTGRPRTGPLPVIRYRHLDADLKPGLVQEPNSGDADARPEVARHEDHHETAGRYHETLGKRQSLD